MQAPLHAGLRRAFQQLRVFPAPTVAQNLLTAAQAHADASMLGEILRSPGVRRTEVAAVGCAASLLDELGLAAEQARPAAALSYGQKKLVERLDHGRVGMYDRADAILRHPDIRRLFLGL